MAPQDRTGSAIVTKLFWGLKTLIFPGATQVGLVPVAAPFRVTASLKTRSSR